MNAALATVPLVPQLRDGTVELVAPAGADPLDELLARAATSALELLASPALAYCDAPSCGQFFMRSRRDQRWCGPACGTRTRVARHASRSAEPVAEPPSLRHDRPQARVVSASSTAASRDAGGDQRVEQEPTRRRA